MAAHSYWRILVTQVRDPTLSTVAITELRMFTGAGSTTSCVGGTGTADSVTTTHVAANAFDGVVTGSSSDWWSANTALPHWLRYDFAAPVDIVGIQVFSVASLPGSAPAVYSVEYSDDGSTWTTSWSIEDHEVWPNSIANRFYWNPAIFSDAENLTLPQPIQFLEASFAGAVETENFMMSSVMDFSGEGIISGVVQIQGVVNTSNARVKIYHAATETYIKDTFSSSLGTYEITGLKEDEEYDLIAQDAAAAWEKRISSRRVPFTRDHLDLEFVGGEDLSAALTIAPFHYRPATGESVEADLYTFTSLLHFDGANGSTVFTDESGLVWTGSGNAQISTTQSKFGGSSLSLDGTGDTLASSANPPNHHITNRNFVFRSWVWLSTNTANGLQRTLISKLNSYRWSVIAVSGSSYLYFLGLTSGATGLSFQSTVPMPLNQWVYVELNRIGGTLSHFQDGVLVGRQYIGDGESFVAASAQTKIGSYDSNNYWHGYIDDMQMQIGATGNAANYTSPVAPFIP